jgi:hypothetical protein
MRRTSSVVGAVVLSALAVSLPVGAALGSGPQPDGTSPPGPLRTAPALGEGQPPAAPAPETSSVDRAERHEVGRAEVASVPGQGSGARRDDGGAPGADLAGGRRD